MSAPFKPAPNPETLKKAVAWLNRCRASDREGWEISNGFLVFALSKDEMRYEMWRGRLDFEWPVLKDALAKTLKFLEMISQSNAD